MAQLFANFAATTLAESLSSVATSVEVADGSAFPSPTGGDFFLLVLATAVTEATREIVKVTARSGNLLTIVRAQEGTTAAAFASGDKAELRLTAASVGANVQQTDPAVVAQFGTISVTAKAILGVYEENIGTFTELIPVMTSNTAPSGVAFFSTEHSATYAAWHAYDGNATTYWDSASSQTVGPWILGYQFPTAKTVSRYTLNCVNNSAYAPIAWTFEGSNDGVSYTVLDTRTGYTAANWAAPLSFVVATPQPFTHYRLRCTDFGGKGGVNILVIGSFGMQSSASNWYRALLAPADYQVDRTASGGLQTCAITRLKSGSAKMVVDYLT